jgi:hypothetical protein
MCVGNLPLEKKHIFCSVYIYLSFHLRQYSWNRFNIFCKLLADSAKRAVSSAYIIKNNNQALVLIHQIKFSNQLHYSFLKRFPNHLSIKKIGKDIRFLCLTPFPQVKKWEYSLLYIILDFTLWYILTNGITLCILPLILFMSNLHHKPSLQSVAKAFSKSMNAQNIFFLFQG